MVATEARAAGLPILVIVTVAEDAGAAALQRLATLIESVPDARAAVRLVLLGGPLLEDILAHPDAEQLSAHIVTTVRAPSRGSRRWVIPLAAPLLGASWRDTAQWGIAGLLAALGVFLIVSPWMGRDASLPIGVQAAAPEAEDVAPEMALTEDVSEPDEAVEAEAPAAEQHAAAPVAAPEKAAAPAPPAAHAGDEPAPGQVAEPPAAAPPAPAAAPVGTEAPRDSLERAARRPPPLGQSLQVGAFRNAANARALAEKLGARFPDVRVVTVTRGGAPFHCVRLGGFADEYALAARAHELRAAGYASIRAPE
jgi:cell division septation protein DedD